MISNNSNQEHKISEEQEESLNVEAFINFLLRNKLILLSPGAITRNELRNLKQKIYFQGISFLGALIINLEPLSFSENYFKREELLKKFRRKYKDLFNIFLNWNYAN